MLCPALLICTLLCTLLLCASVRVSLQQRLPQSSSIQSESSSQTLGVWHLTMRKFQVITRIRLLRRLPFQVSSVYSQILIRAIPALDSEELNNIFSDGNSWVGFWRSETISGESVRSEQFAGMALMNICEYTDETRDKVHAEVDLISSLYDPRERVIS